MLCAPLRPRSSARRRFLASLLAPLTGAVLIAGAGAAAAAAPATAHSKTIAVPAHTSSAAHLSAAQKRAAFGVDVLAEAQSHAGAPYVFGASGPGAFDCSGFTSYVYRSMGIFLPHTSYGQYAMTEHIPQGAARPGDLIFLNGLGHVAIYAGHGMMWDAPSPGGRVSERPIYSSSYLVGRVQL